MRANKPSANHIKEADKSPDHDPYPPVKEVIKSKSQTLLPENDHWSATRLNLIVQCLMEKFVKGSITLTSLIGALTSLEPYFYKRCDVSDARYVSECILCDWVWWTENILTKSEVKQRVRLYQKLCDTHCGGFRRMMRVYKEFVPKGNIKNDVERILQDKLLEGTHASHKAR